jgi:electron transport complex protein RnfA
MDLFYLSVSAIFVNNILLAQYLGNCPFLGFPKTGNRAGYGHGGGFCDHHGGYLYLGRVHLFSQPYGLEFLQTLSFILIIASLVQLVEIIMKKQSRVLYNALGVYLPLITTNCAVMGVALLVARKEYGFIEMLVFSSMSAVGFGLALIVFAGIRERLMISAVPQSLRGTSIALITAGIMALAFIGFQGMA